MSEEASDVQNHFNNKISIFFILNIPRIKYWDDLSLQ